MFQKFSSYHSIAMRRFQTSQVFTFLKIWIASRQFHRRTTFMFSECICQFWRFAYRHKIRFMSHVLTSGNFLFPTLTKVFILLKIFRQFSVFIKPFFIRHNSILNTIKYLLKFWKISKDYSLYNFSDHFNSKQNRLRLRETFQF